MGNKAYSIVVLALLLLLASVTAYSPSQKIALCFTCLTNEGATDSACSDANATIFASNWSSFFPDTAFVQVTTPVAMKGFRCANFTIPTLALEGRYYVQYNATNTNGTIGGGLDWFDVNINYSIQQVLIGQQNNLSLLFTNISAASQEAQKNISGIETRLIVDTTNRITNLNLSLANNLTTEINNRITALNLSIANAFNSNTSSLKANISQASSDIQINVSTSNTLQHNAILNGIAPNISNATAAIFSNISSMSANIQAFLNANAGNLVWAYANGRNLTYINFTQNWNLTLSNTSYADQNVTIMSLFARIYQNATDIEANISGIETRVINNVSQASRDIQKNITNSVLITFSTPDLTVLRLGIEGNISNATAAIFGNISASVANTQSFMLANERGTDSAYLASTGATDLGLIRTNISAASANIQQNASQLVFSVWTYPLGRNLTYYNLSIGQVNATVDFSQVLANISQASRDIQFNSSASIISAIPPFIGNMLPSAVVIVPMLLGFLMMFGVISLGKDHPELKWILFVASFGMYFISAWFALEGLGNTSTLTPLINALGNATMIIAAIFVALIFYVMGMFTLTVINMLTKKKYDRLNYDTKK